MRTRCTRSALCRADGRRWVTRCSCRPTSSFSPRARSYSIRFADCSTDGNHLETVSGELLTRETISGDEFYLLIGKKRPTGRSGEDIGPVSTPNGKLVDQTAP